MTDIFKIEKSRKLLKQSQDLIKQSKQQELLDASQRLSPAYLSGSSWYKNMKQDNSILSTGDIGLLGTLYTIANLKGTQS